jgi:hypothetical protein
MEPRAQGNFERSEASGKGERLGKSEKDGKRKKGNQTLLTT